MGLRAKSVRQNTLFCKTAFMEILSTGLKLSAKKRKSQVPTHIYKRGDFYYFRAVFPDSLKERFGQEIRFSLITPFRKKALELSGKLFVEFQKLLESLDMDLKELRFRLNKNIQMKLEEDTMTIPLSFMANELTTW
ncbi:MAG: hypothetical protein LBI10_01460 [Deltaproteobacteria bacterium]|nr:hypothetical protein [Deltaproteobacteria bacterium]